MERIWKEVVVACSSYIPGTYLEGLTKRQKTSVGVDDVPADIRTENFSNTSLDRPLPRFHCPLGVSV
jgi:hypothetical protein